MSRIERLARRKLELQRAYDTLTEERDEIRQAWAIETDPGVKLKYEKQAQKLEQEREECERHLEEIENITATNSIKNEIERIDFGLVAVAEMIMKIEQTCTRIEQKCDLLLLRADHT